MTKKGDIENATNLKQECDEFKKIMGVSSLFRLDTKCNDDEKMMDDEEKFKSINRRYDNRLERLNLDDICNDDEKKMEENEEKFESIYRRYDNRLKELNREVAINELFLFSILTERIKTAKALWRRGKVRSFNYAFIILKLISL